MNTGQRRSLCRFYTQTSTVSGQMRTRVTTWTAGARAWGGFVPSFLTVRSFGAGEVGSGTREIEMAAGSGAETGNGLEVEAGPESGSRWRVVAIDESEPGKEKLRLEPFAGSFE